MTPLSHPTLGLALVALVVVPLAQVPLVLYLGRYVELDAGEPQPATDRGCVTDGTASARPDPSGGAVLCPSCGAAVPDAYDYCGACAERLPPAWGRR